MIGVRPAGPLSVCGEICNVAISPDIINMINVKLCMMAVLTELYPFPLMPLSVTLIAFEGHSSVKQLNILCSYPIM